MPGPPIAPDVSYDAVVVVPGIMGSVLREAATGTILWGFTETRRYTWLWGESDLVDRLAVTPEEREGKVGRVEATALVSRPAIAPFLRGLEPYDSLMERLLGAVADAAAVQAFPYDWRLPVEHNARGLARFARAHLDEWRANGIHQGRDAEAPRLVVVAHSMGGLLARALALVEDQDDVPPITSDIRATVTLGTPFHGAVKAAVLLQTGAGTPLKWFAHEGRMRRLARTLPGVHDLLPFHRCVEENRMARRFTDADAAAVGADPELAAAARAFRERLVQVELPNHRPMVGTRQPTFHTICVDSGSLEGREYELVWDADAGADRVPATRRASTGDETVAQFSAKAEHEAPAYLPQTHGALAKKKEGVDFVVSVLLEEPPRSRLGDSAIGLRAPDVAPAGRPWRVRVEGIDHVSEARVWLEETEHDRQVGPPLALEVADGAIEASVVAPAPGVYRVSALSGGTSAISQLVLVGDG